MKVLLKEIRINKVKKRIFEIIEKAQTGDRASYYFDIFLVTLIILNVIAIILASVKSIYAVFHNVFKTFEIISVMVFTVEYLLRVWTSEYKIKTKHRIITKIKYIFTPMAIIDLMAILPFYLPLLLPIDLRFLRILRLTRLLRLLKVQRYSQSLQLIGKVMKKKKEELVVTIFVTFILMVFASTLMFYLESDVQPDQFPNIISTFWWAIATLTTIGYGDVYPVTGWGRLLSGFIAILGIGLVALPTGILSSGFIEELSRQKSKNIEKPEQYKYCPYCGKMIDKDT
ncbi:MAG: ion transporter [Spirochaetes bacterium]|nr:ion transporter [Spirochaetota bacterium]